MRLRNIPRADSVIQAHPMVVPKEKQTEGNWHQIFQNQYPIFVEIGMGKGQFLLQMAEKYPKRNFIGIERYASVLLRAVEKVDTPRYRELVNVRFLCVDARRLSEIFGEREVQGIYLNFSDPWPKARHAKRRLTSGNFLKAYKRILEPKGYLACKTDNAQLFDFSLEELSAAGWHIQQMTRDLHHDERMCVDNIMTEYEAKFSAKGNPICKCIAYPPTGRVFFD